MTSTLRPCLRDPIPEIFEAARLMSAAVDRHLAGDRAGAADLFRAADIRAVWEWTDSIWGKRDPAIHTIREVPHTPPFVPREARIRVRMPNSAEKRALIQHWGFRCAFCGIPLVQDGVRKRAVKLYPDAVSWGPRNTLQHAAFMAMWLQFDHIVPHARGGDNAFSNMVVTCAACNFGRMNFTLEEMGLADPRARPVIATEWDGLERFR